MARLATVYTLTDLKALPTGATPTMAALWYFLRARELEGHGGATRQEMERLTHLSERGVKSGTEAMVAARLIKGTTPEPRRKRRPKKQKPTNTDQVSRVKIRGEISTPDPEHASG